MGAIDKSTFLNACVCRRLGWFVGRKQAGAAPTLAERLRMQEGQELHAKARSAKPGGTVASAGSGSDAVSRSSQLVQDGNTRTAYEVTFQRSPVIARADILSRIGAGWNVVEVKSSLESKPELVDDLAFTVMVCKGAGLPISAATLMLVSKDYRLGDSDAALFHDVDSTELALQRSAELDQLSSQVISAIDRSTAPSATPSYECRNCPLLDDCVGSGIDNPIFEIPRLGAGKCDALLSQGIMRIESVPADFLLSATQRRVVDSVRSGRRFVGRGLATKLAEVAWPAYYLDFETFKPVVPLYPDTAPHTQIPTQYSIHVCDSPGHDVSHTDYLADPSRDCRRDLALQLLRDLGGQGSIIAYSSFEKTTINALASIAQCSDIADNLRALTGRIVDLHSIVMSELYDPAFHGSTSIKAVLPVIVPNLSYDGLEIKDGDTALATFAFMARGELTGAEADAAKVNLREYCKRDTLAMVCLHEALYSMA